MREWCGKTPHQSEVAARRHMLLQVRRCGKKYGKVRVYRCDVCGFWHFGHRNDAVKRRLS